MVRQGSQITSTLYSSTWTVQLVSTKDTTSATRWWANGVITLDNVTEASSLTKRDEQINNWFLKLLISNFISILSDSS